LVSTRYKLSDSGDRSPLYNKKNIASCQTGDILKMVVFL